MSTSTAKLGLVKGGGTDNVSVLAHINAAFDKIDTALPTQVCTSGTRPGTPFNGQLIYETDTNNMMIWNGTKWWPVAASFDTVAARNAALASPQEGMTVWLEDVNRFEIYDGTNWTEFLSLGAWTAYTPALTAATTDPTLGTGSAQVGKYRRIGSLVTVQGKITFGTSGAAAGAGAYRIGLPFTLLSTTGNSPVGSALITDNSGAVSAWVALTASGSTLYAVMRYPLTWPTGTLTVVGSAAPWTWANLDDISFALTYETSDA